MGKLLVVGSVALDTVKTPFGEGTDILGGSATYFSTSASFFTAVSLIAVVGEDFPTQHTAFLKSRGIDLTGLEQRPERHGDRFVDRRYVHPDCRECGRLHGRLQTR